MCACVCVCVCVCVCIRKWERPLGAGQVSREVRVMRGS